MPDYRTSGVGIEQVSLRALRARSRLVTANASVKIHRRTHRL